MHTLRQTQEIHMNITQHMNADAPIQERGSHMNGLICMKMMQICQDFFCLCHPAVFKKTKSSTYLTSEGALYPVTNSLSLLVWELSHSVKRGFTKQVFDFRVSQYRGNWKLLGKNEKEVKIQNENKAKRLTWNVRKTSKWGCVLTGLTLLVSRWFLIPSHVSQQKRNNFGFSALWICLTHHVMTLKPFQRVQ